MFCKAASPPLSRAAGTSAAGWGWGVPHHTSDGWVYLGRLSLVCVCVLTEYKEWRKVASKWLDCILRAPVPIFLSQVCLLRGAERSNAGLLQACHLLTCTIQHLFAIFIYYRSSLKWERFCFSCSFHFFFLRRAKTRLLDSAEPWVSCFSRWTSHITASKHAEKCLHSWTHRRRTRVRD